MAEISAALKRVTENYRQYIKQIKQVEDALQPNVLSAFEALNNFWRTGKCDADSKANNQELIGVIQKNLTLVPVLELKEALSNFAALCEIWYLNEEKFKEFQNAMGGREASPIMAPPPSSPQSILPEPPKPPSPPEPTSPPKPPKPKSAKNYLAAAGLIIYFLVAYQMLAGFWTIIGAWIMGGMVWVTLEGVFTKREELVKTAIFFSFLTGYLPVTWMLYDGFVMIAGIWAAGVLLSFAFMYAGREITKVLACIFTVISMILIWLPADRYENVIVMLAGKSGNEKLEETKKTTEEPLPEKYFVRSETLTVRSGAGDSYQKLGTLKRNEQIEISGINNGWATVNYNGTKGYVKSDNLTKDTPKQSYSQPKETPKQPENLTGEIQKPVTPKEKQKSEPQPEAKTAAPQQTTAPKTVPQTEAATQTATPPQTAATDNRSNVSSVTQAAGNVAGVYNSTQGTLTLMQNGSNVTGKYPDNNGSLQGTLNGNILTGSYQDKSGTGKISFEFKNNFSAFSGACSMGNGDLLYPWSGERLSAIQPKPVRIGKVSVPSRRMKVQVTKAELTDNGKNFLLEFMLTNQGDDIDSYVFEFGKYSSATAAYDNSGNQASIVAMKFDSRNSQFDNISNALPGKKPVKITAVISGFDSGATNFDKIIIHAKAYDSNAHPDAKGDYIFQNVAINR